MGIHRDSNINRDAHGNTITGGAEANRPSGQAIQSQEQNQQGGSGK